MQVTELPPAPCPLLPRPPLESCPTSLPTTAIMSATSSASGYIVYCILSHQLGAMQTIYLLSCPIVISCFSLVWVMVSWCWKNRLKELKSYSVADLFRETYFPQKRMFKVSNPHATLSADCSGDCDGCHGDWISHMTCDLWHVTRWPLQLPLMFINPNQPPIIHLVSRLQSCGGLFAPVSHLKEQNCTIFVPVIFVIYNYSPQ